MLIFVPNTEVLPLFILIITLAVVFARIASAHKSLSHIPFAGEGSRSERITAYQSQAKSLLRTGYRSFKGIFRILTPEGDHVIVSHQLLDEIKSMPDDLVSSHEAIETLVEKKLTNVIATSHLMIHSLRSDLTPALPRIMPQLSQIAADAIEADFPKCDDWTPINLHHKLLRIIAVMSGWVFLGPKLHQHEDYMHFAIHYATDAIQGPYQLKRWRKWLRPIVAKIGIPELRRIQDHRRRVCQFLVPEIQARRAEAKKRNQSSDMLQWMIDRAPEFRDEIKSDEDLAILQLVLSAVAIHTTQITVTSVMYDIACRPGLLKELREEIVTVLKDHNNQLGSQALYDMKLLDSVMKESQRLNPGEVVGVRRMALKPFDFSDGTHIPAGTILEAPIEAIGHDEAIFPDAETFDPYRFCKLREMDHGYQFVSPGKGSMAFGYGRHACPGRFFASTEIKLILAHILHRYSFAMPEKTTERYANIQTGTYVRCPYARSREPPKN